MTHTPDNFQRTFLSMADQKAPNMPARIYSDILNRIIEGEYQEGARLPTEHALAEQFATSRPTVREARASCKPIGTRARPVGTRAGAIGAG